MTDAGPFPYVSTGGVVLVTVGRREKPIGTRFAKGFAEARQRKRAPHRPVRPAPAWRMVTGDIETRFPALAVDRAAVNASPAMRTWGPESRRKRVDGPGEQRLRTSRGRKGKGILDIGGRTCEGGEVSFPQPPCFQRSLRFRASGFFCFFCFPGYAAGNAAAATFIK